MAKCKICGGNVWCGVVLHTECFERLHPVWHPESDTPMTHVEYIETDEGQEPYNVSMADQPGQRLPETLRFLRIPNRRAVSRWGGGI